jgi:hypothetical protein
MVTRTGITFGIKTSTFPLAGGFRIGAEEDVEAGDPSRMATTIAV